MERQIPRSIQYSDLKPEAIENQVKLVRFTPQTNIQNQIPNDVVRFMLAGNGFFDPYSSYVYMQVDFGDAKENFKWESPADVRADYSKLKKYWDNVGKLKTNTLSIDGTDVYSPGYSAENEIGFTFTAQELDHQNIVLTKLPQTFAEARPTIPYSKGDFAAIADEAWVNNTYLLTGNSDAVAATEAVGTTILSLPQVEPSGHNSTMPLPGAEFKMLDRSAHSFINRLVIRSQGTEVERIEQYDVVAAMLNDLIYSNEQAQFHSFEGFGGAPCIQTTNVSSSLTLTRSTMANSISGPRGRAGERIWGWAFAAIEESPLQQQMGADLTFDLQQHGYANGTQLQIQAEARALLSKSISAKSAEVYSYTDATVRDFTNFNAEANDTLQNTQYRYVYSEDLHIFTKQVKTEADDQGLPKSAAKLEPHLIDKVFMGNTHHPIYKFLEKASVSSRLDFMNKLNFMALDDINVSFFRSGNYRMNQIGAQSYEFIVPIYSGLIGVLMPEKKLIPLSLMPLEVDFTLNPHALMCGYSAGFGDKLTRNYTMKKMEIFSHMIFFEQEVHRSMESIVAEHGLFLHINTFYMAPVTLHGGNGVTQNIPINLHFKNINSIHMVNLYTKYLTDRSARKLHFVSHNINSLQLRNGSDLTPSEPLQMTSTAVNAWEKHSIQGGRYNKIFMELLKSYNKMHDPTCDTALDAGLTYQMDNYAVLSSQLADDYDVYGKKFSEKNVVDQALVRADWINQKIVCPGDIRFGDWVIKKTVINTDLGKMVKLSEARAYVRTTKLFLGEGAGINPRGQWGINPKHISKRPNVFYAPISASPEFIGFSSQLLSDKLQRFSALTGRCQYALSLEGINLGSDNGMLCGKRGMIPFDLMVVGEKSDSEQSMSLVFAKCDFIVYIRPDLVVTVLGK